MLERMSEFFERRLDGYDEHMLSNIESAREFYPFTASRLPLGDGCRVLDLGCGTGLELEEYFKLNGGAVVVGVDLSRGMLDELKRKMPTRDLTLICGSYFDIPFGEACFDAAVSVESLHHFTAEEKLPLYKRLCASLVDGGYFIMTDYFASSDEEERSCRAELRRLKVEQGIKDGDFYHYDTPLTVEHERETLIKAGFDFVEIIGRWGATATLKAARR